METAFEREKRYAKEREYRTANIGEIEARLDEAMGLYWLTDAFSEERGIVLAEIKNLEAMLQDEKKALATIGSDDINAPQVVEQMPM